MTGYTVHTGSSKKFSQGWDQIFKGQAAAKSAQPAAKKQAVKKPEAKPGPAKPSPTTRKSK